MHKKNPGRIFWCLGFLKTPFSFSYVLLSKCRPTPLPVHGHSYCSGAGHFSTGVEGAEHVKWDYRGQRSSVPLGPWVPDIAVDAFLAPNAVVVGRVVVQDSSSVWYGSVLRGDLNKVFVGFCSNVQEKCVLHAAQLSPTGLPAETFINSFVTIGANSLLRSCHIEFESIIGQRCILMEGSLVEAHAILEAGSVLPPGRRIPSGELWGGNPAKFIRLLILDEVAAIPKNCKIR